MITDLFPKITPSLDLNFARAQKLDSRITFSRPSAATYFDRNGIFRTAASGVPRFDFDPITGACKGLLIEEQRTNLLIYSEQFDDAAWAKARSSITANAAIAPDGTLTADKLVEDTTASNTHVVNSAFSATSGLTYTASVYVKAGERSECALQLSGAFTATTQVRVNLSTGSVLDTSGTPVNGGVDPLGNGWYRVYVAQTASATTTALVIVYISNGGTTIYTGDGTSGLYIWGAQLESGRFPTSYIKTEATQVSRATDVATMTGTSFSSWYRQDEGTFIAEAMVGTDRNYSGSFRHILAASPAASSNSRIALLVTALNRFNLVVADGGVTQADLSHGSNTGAPFEMAGAYKVNDFAVSANGAPVVTDTSGQTPVTFAPTQIVFGGTLDGNASGRLNGHISRLAYYPKRLTNTELQALTA